MKEPKLASEESIKKAEKIVNDLTAYYNEKVKDNTGVMHSLVINMFVTAHCRFMENNFGTPNKNTRYHFLKHLERCVKYNFRRIKV